MENKWKKNRKNKMGDVWQCVGRATGRKKRERTFGKKKLGRTKIRRKNENEKRMKSKEMRGDGSLDVSGTAKRERVGGMVGKGMGEK